MEKIFILFSIATINVFAQSDITSLPVKENNKTAAPVAIKRVLIEEATGTWCGYCVRGIVAMDELNKNYPTTTGLVAVHSGDPMQPDGYGVGVSGYPRGYVDRFWFDAQDGSRIIEIDPINFEEAYLERMKYIPAIDVFIDDISWNAASRLLSFRVNAKTVAAFNGSYRFNAVITEMQVHGTTSDYDQKNYYAAIYDDGPMGGFENKPAVIPAADMYYDFVGRGLLDGWGGTANSIPKTNAAGQTISYTYTKIIPADWNEKNLNLIGFVINDSLDYIENASLTVKLQSVITGIDTESKHDLIIYPNPTTGLIHIKDAGPMDITVYNITGGQVLKTEGNVSQMNISDLPQGIYFVKFDNKKEIYTKKIVLVK